MTYSDMKNRMQSNGNINLKWSPGENTCVCSNCKLNRKLTFMKQVLMCGRLKKKKAKNCPSL